VATEVQALEAAPAAGRSGSQTSDHPEAGGTPVRRAGHWWPAIICCGLYLVLSMLDFGHFGTLGSAHMAGFRGEDEIIQVWWIAWAQFALTHGHNLFFTTWQNYPAGQNGGVNSSILALGVPFAPITRLFGPLVSWNILLRLTLAVSAASMCLVLRRWVAWWPAAFLGGLLYGFSAYETVLASGYLFLAFAPLPPLLFLLAHEALVRQQWPPRRVGVGFAVACTVQFFISTEILASSVLMVVVAAVLYLVVNRKSLATSVPYMKTAGLYAAVVSAVLLVVPAVFTFLGPEAIIGTPNTPAGLAAGHGDLLGPFIPASFEWITTRHLSAVWEPRLVNSAMLYLGIPFFLMAVVTVLVLRRRGIVAMAGAMAAISFVLSMGSILYVGGNDTHIPLPFDILAQLPVTSGLLPIRFALFTSLFGAAIVALGIEALYRRVARPGAADHGTTGGRKVLAVGLSLAVAAVVALPLLPAHTRGVTPTEASPFFTSKSAVANIPTGSVVLAYPYPGLPQFPGSGFTYSYRYQSVNDVLVDQAVAGMRFKLVGGFGWRPNGVHGSANPTVLDPPSIEDLFNLAFYGTGSAEEFRTVLAGNMTTDIRDFVRRYGVGTVVVFPLGHDPAAIVQRVTQALGTPTRADGATVWYHVARRLAARSSSP
jgi:hypothetical protein